MIRQNAVDFISVVSLNSRSTPLQLCPFLHHTTRAGGKRQFSCGYEMSKPIRHKILMSVGDNRATANELTIFDNSFLLLSQA